MKKGIVILFSFFIYFGSYAQLVNIETLKKEKKEGWQGAFQGAFSITQNTKKIFSVKGNGGLQYSHQQNTFLFFGNFTFLKIDTLSNLINGGFEHFRYTHRFKNEKWSVEYFVQHQFNYIKYLKLRAISGGGLRYKLVNTDKIYFHLAPLLMFEHEVYNDDVNTITNYIKGDFIVTFGLNLSENISFSNVTYYQPRIYSWADFRISSETGFRFKFQKNFSFGSSFVLNYDAQPPVKNNVKIEKMFFNLSNTLSYTF